MAFFHENGGENLASGCLAQGEGMKPSMDGSIVYLNAGKDLSTVLNKVEKAGGKILMPKTAIGEHGFIAQFTDSEGGRVALHSMS